VYVASVGVILLLLTPLLLLHSWTLLIGLILAAPFILLYIEVFLLIKALGECHEQEMELLGELDCKFADLVGAGA
jgi:hypothetical protein